MPRISFILPGPVQSRLLTVVLVLSATGLASADDIPNIEITEPTPSAQPSELAVLKLPGERRALPVSTEIVDRALIEVAGSSDVGGLLAIATSAVTVASEGGSVNDIILRGFSGTPFYRNGLNDSLGQLAPRPLASVERIEVLKGPNAALFGPGEPGGSINLVTRRPERVRAMSVGAELGRFSSLDLSVDSTGAIPALENWQYRLIGSREQGDTFRDFVKHDRWFVAPSLAWQPATNTDVVASVEYLRDERLLDAGIFIAEGLPRPHRATFLGEPALGPAIIDGLTGQITATTALARQWQFEFQIQGQRTRLAGSSVEPGELLGTMLAREALERDEAVESWITQFEIYGPLEFWRTRHDLLFGVETADVDEHVRLFGSDPEREPFFIDPYRPLYGAPPPSRTTQRLSRERRRQYSTYARDRVTFDEHWQVLLGVRLDHIDQSGNDRASDLRFDRTSLKLSPRVSLVYDTTRGVLGYASYSQSVDPNEGLQPDGEPLVPTLARSIEGGLRWHSPDLRNAIDVAVFGIRQSNVTVDAPGSPGFELQTATQEHLGVDLEYEFRPDPRLSLRARYNWLDTRIIDDPLVPDGTPALNTPKHQAAALAIVHAGILRPADFDLGLAVSYVGRRSASLDPDELDLELAGYVRIDAFARWRVGAHLDLGINLENLGNADYIQGSQSDAFSLSPGAPLTVRGVVRWHF